MTALLKPESRQAGSSDLEVLLLLIGRAVSGAGAHRQRVVDKLAQQLHHLKQAGRKSRS